MLTCRENQETCLFPPKIIMCNLKTHHKPPTYLDSRKLDPRKHLLAGRTAGARCKTWRAASILPSSSSRMQATATSWCTRSGSKAKSTWQTPPAARPALPTGRAENVKEVTKNRVAALRNQVAPHERKYSSLAVLNPHTSIMVHAIATASALKSSLLAAAGGKRPDIRPKHDVLSQAPSVCSPASRTLTRPMPTPPPSSTKVPSTSPRNTPTRFGLGRPCCRPRARPSVIPRLGLCSAHS